MSSERTSRRDPEDLEARVAMLRQRMRRGELTADRVRAASHLGEPRARALFPGGAYPRETLPGFDLLSPSEKRLFACDCVERLLPIYQRALPNHEALASALALLRRVARGQARESELPRARALANFAYEAASDPDSHGPPYIRANLAQMVARSVGSLALADLGRELYFPTFLASLQLIAQDARASVGTDSAEGAARWQRRRLAWYLLAEAE